MVFRATLACVVASAAFGLFSDTTQAQTQRPNVLLIITDDLGYADLGAYGAKDIPTPNIDQLIRSGVQFTDAYVTGVYCSPTRAGLMTGATRSALATSFSPKGSARGAWNGDR